MPSLSENVEPSSTKHDDSSESTPQPSSQVNPAASSPPPIQTATTDLTTEKSTTGTSNRGNQYEDIDDSPIDVKSEEPSKFYKPSTADMKHYYEHYLPFKSIFLWLNHSQIPKKDFINREFAFEYKSGAYHRFNSFGNLNEFKSTVIKSQPTRFEIGAVYPIQPKLRKSVSKNLMRPMSKDFILDIDLTDYDDIRTCCKGTSICEKCWKFITLAIKIINMALVEDFGFKHLIWVFSGRRGVHCWISDYRARILDEHKRRSIVEYLDVLNVKSNKSKSLINLRKPYHPHIERSFNLLRNEFVNIIIREQDPWRLNDRFEDLARSLPDYKLTTALIKYWKEDAQMGRSSADKWVDIDKFYNNMNIKSFNIQDWKKEMIFKTMYPRLDIEVSKQMNHLLKSPFCVHPGTGNICVPFDPSEKEFSPFTDAPNLKQVFEEDDLNVEKTSLNSSIQLFNKFISNLVKEEIKEKRQREEDDNEGDHELEF